MFCIRKIRLDKNGVDLKVDGILNEKYLPLLKKHIKKYISSHAGIRLHLEDIVSCDQNGIYFLIEHQKRIEMLGMPDFLRLQMDLKSCNVKI